MFKDAVNSNPVRHLRNDKRSETSLVSRSLVGSLLGPIWLLVFWVVSIAVPQATARRDLPQISLFVKWRMYPI